MGASKDCDLAIAQGDWTIEDFVALCREYRIRCTPPSRGGSHWKVSDPRQRDILTVPARRSLLGGLQADAWLVAVGELNAGGFESGMSAFEDKSLAPQ